MTNERTKAIEMARELVRTTRYTPEQACEAVLRTDTGARLSLSRDQLKALAFGATFHGWGKVTRVVVPLAVFAWLIGSTVAGNTRTCRYRDYTGRVYSVVQPAAHTCDSRIEVPSC